MQDRIEQMQLVELIHLLWKDPASGVEGSMPEGMTEADLILSEKDTKWDGIEEYKKERNI